jgi:hypothetical protein
MSKNEPNITRRNFLIGGSVAATVALTSSYLSQIERTGAVILRAPAAYDSVLYADESRGFLLILDYTYDQATETLSDRYMTWREYLAWKGDITDADSLRLSDFRNAYQGYDVAPRQLPYIGTPSPELWKRTALFAGTTHNDPGNIACCVGFVKLLGDLLVMAKSPEPSWWLDTFEKIACPVEGDTQYNPRGGEWQGKYVGSLTKFAVEKSREALEKNLDAVQLGQQVFSGAYLMETMPMVLFILAKWGHDPKQAIIAAVNDTKDNDTVAAIVGAAVGALHGEEALPIRWRDNLLGRLGHDDDGRVQALLEASCDRWLRPTALSVDVARENYSTTATGEEG